MVNAFIKKLSPALTRYLAGVSLACLPALSFAGEMDPMTTAGNKFMLILFGSLGTALCCLIIGGTFVMAKTGKVSWDRFLFIGFCAAGFLGTPSIVAMIRNMVQG